jgi:hypothetical protein
MLWLYHPKAVAIAIPLPGSIHIPTQAIATMHSLTTYIAIIALLGFVLYSFTKAIIRHNAKNNPQGLPGPALLPWIGRIHDLPIEYMWLKFKEWADIYGPIYRTKMLGANFIIVSDEAIAEELLVKRAKVNSDRPRIQSLFDSKSTFGSMEYLPLMGKNSQSSLYQMIRHPVDTYQNTGLDNGSSPTRI